MSTRGRKQANGSSSSAPEPTNSIDQNENSTTTTSSVVGLLKTPSVDVQREEVKVNNASVTDMKHACDDALKRVSTVLFRVCVYSVPFVAFTLPCSPYTLFMHPAVA